MIGTMMGLVAVVSGCFSLALLWREICRLDKVVNNLHQRLFVVENRPR